jgi:hypothetical protein
MQDPDRISDQALDWLIVDRHTRRRDGPIRPRSAILLIAGNKSSQWNRWYGEAIPEAE